MKAGLLLLFVFVLLSCQGTASIKTQSEEISNMSITKQKDYIKSDVYETENGSIKVTLIGHGSLMFEFQEKIIYIDPYSKVADYSKLPKADIILLTHEHSDHLDTLAINSIKKDDTYFLMPQVCKDILGYGNVINNGELTDKISIFSEILAVPAYNIVNKRNSGEAYHPKGRGNGYIIRINSFVIYVAGDTENIPEMENLGPVDIAFLPKNLPYTMSDDMFIDAAHKVNPKNLYPYHFSEFKEEKITDALKDTNIKILVRPMSNL